jgi:hypothetical protein
LIPRSPMKRSRFSGTLLLDRLTACPSDRLTV